ncbi:TPA: hypothetical protein HA235_04730 [Candidatus Woesearchaeota archaeon]|nr:hypothetical protein [Candidatus Woesearchaeota archaeon]HIH54759.1 hypothetical protein [Candidatus Woesearchaeota archaeon]HIJ01942.1 hypothetical protein [Candidatus Woesearchaeota archaeon]HIJ14768.1 hypothetical protein [Candidatus Woesearchaeota archaeon]
MIIQVILAMLSGIFIGIITGLTPGIHINMASLLVLSLSPILMMKFSIEPLSMAIFIIAMGVTHTFLDALPSIFLGAPDEATALGVLPGHRYLLNGNGLMAVKLFTIGSFFGLIFGIMIFPLLYLITKYSYDFFNDFFAWILIFVILFMIYRDNKKLWSVFIVVLSGIFGLIVFNTNLKDPLFPMLSGLFGLSTLIISYFDNNNIPKQNIMDTTIIERKKTLFSIIAGNIGSFIVSTFPGLSSSIAAVMSMQVIKNIGDKGFMILLGCIGTSSFILSLVALYTIEKARNGAVIVISKLISIDLGVLLILLTVALITGAVSVILSLWIGRIFSRLITVINYKILVVCIIALVTSLVIIMTSWLGLLVLIVSTSIGLIPGIVKIQRTHSMACIMIPVIVYLI